MTVRSRHGSFVVVLLVAICGCAQDDRSGPEWTLHSDSSHGYQVSFPPSWHLAAMRLSRTSDPRELFSLATLPLTWQPTDCDAFAGAAGTGMGPGDVAITVWERGVDPNSAWLDFPPRPESFGPVRDAEAAGRGCGEPPGTMIHWRNFGDAGRHLHTLVRIGAEAPPGTAEEAWRILDGLDLDRGYRPRWRASG